MKDVITFLTEREIKGTKPQPLTQEELNQLEHITGLQFEESTKDNHYVAQIDGENLNEFYDFFVKNIGDLAQISYGNELDNFGCFSSEELEDMIEGTKYTLKGGQTLNSLASDVFVEICS